jgi:hypothetical protein
LDFILVDSTGRVLEKMKLNLDKLPEKDYFSIEEIAERWECGTDYVLYLINEEKLLRQALCTRDIQLRNLALVNEKFSLEPIKEILQKLNDGFLFCFLRDNQTDTVFLANYQDIPELKPKIEQLEYQQLQNAIADSDSYPKFLYQKQESTFAAFYYGRDVKTPFERQEKDHDTSSESQFAIDEKVTHHSTIVELQAIPFYLSAEDFSGNEYVAGISSNELGDNHGYPIKLIPYNGFDIIPKEERDRFEQEYGITEKTENVPQQIGQKTINNYKEVIRAMSKYILDRPLSEEPHRDANDIDRVLSRKGIVLPVKPPTIAKYISED